MGRNIPPPEQRAGRDKLFRLLTGFQNRSEAEKDCQSAARRVSFAGQFSGKTGKLKQSFPQSPAISPRWLSPVGLFQEVLMREIHASVQDAQDLDRGFFHPVKDEVVSKQQTADSWMNFPPHPTEVRGSNQFPGTEPHVINISVGRQFIVFGDELPEIHQIIPCRLRNLQLHPLRRLRPISLASLDTCSSQSESWP